MTDIDIKVFNRELENLKLQINWYTSKNIDSASEAQLNAILGSCEKCLERLEEIKDESHKIADKEQYEQNKNVLQELENDLEDFQVKAQSISNKFKSNENSEDVINSIENLNSEKNISIKIPEIPIPKFSGNSEDWYMFKSQFETLIGANKLLKENEKLHYLRSALIGPAKVIRTQDNSYMSLMNALIQQYENKRLIVNSHLKALLNPEKIKGESATDLRALIDETLENLKALEQLNLMSNELSHLMLIHIILQKLDPELQKSYETSLVDTEIPKWDHFIHFLEQRCNILENLQTANLKLSKSFQLEPKTLLNQTSVTPNICGICKLNHPSGYCKNKEMTVSERYNTEETYTGKSDLETCPPVSSSVNALQDLDISFGEKEFNTCNESFFQESHLETHCGTHATKKAFTCTECNSKFSQNCSLKRHLDVVHKGIKLYSCEICSKQFASCFNLRSHLNVHTGERPFECDICNKNFATRYHLRDHHRVHSQEKPFVCTVCNRGFSQSCNLKTHMRTHTGEKPYLCNVCHKRFAERTSLRRHLLHHSSVKQFVCSVCDKKFSHDCSLRMHMRIHTGQMPYSCTTCEKKFTTCSYLKSHRCSDRRVKSETLLHA